MSLEEKSNEQRMIDREVGCLKESVRKGMAYLIEGKCMEAKLSFDDARKISLPLLDKNCRVVLGKAYDSDNKITERLDAYRLFALLKLYDEAHSGEARNDILSEMKTIARGQINIDDNPYFSKLDWRIHELIKILE